MPINQNFLGFFYGNPEKIQDGIRTFIVEVLFVAPVVMAETRRRQARPRITSMAQAVTRVMPVGLLLVCCWVEVAGEVKSPLSVTGPFDKHDHKGSRIIPYFEKMGATSIMQSFIRVSTDRRSGENKTSAALLYYAFCLCWYDTDVECSTAVHVYAGASLSNNTWSCNSVR